MCEGDPEGGREMAPCSLLGENLIRFCFSMFTLCGESRRNIRLKLPDGLLTLLNIRQ